MATAGDTKHLRRKGAGGTWFLQKRIPKHLKNHPQFIGKSMWIESLKTKDLHTARKRRDRLLNDLESMSEVTERQLFEQRVQELRAAHAEHLETIGGEVGPLDTTAYDVFLDSLESTASKLGLPLDSPQLPGWLERDREALIHAQRVDKNEEAPAPLAYAETLKETTERTIKRKEAQGRKEKTLGKIKRATAVFLEYLEARDVPLVSIKRKQVAGFIQTMQEEGKGAKTIQNYITYLSETWKTGRDFEVVSGENPFADHRILGESVEVKPWKEGQIKDLYRLLEDSTGKHADEDALLFKIGVYTGARIDEIHSLTPEDIVEVEIADGSKVLAFHIKPEGDGKTKHSTRYIPVHRALIDDLKGFKGFSGTAQAAGKRFGHLKARYLGAKNTRALVFHSLRHSFSSRIHWANQEKYGETFTRFLTGHASTGTEFEMTYLHPPNMQEFFEAIESQPAIV